MHNIIELAKDEAMKEYIDIHKKYTYNKFCYIAMINKFMKLRAIKKAKKRIKRNLKEMTQSNADYISTYNSYENIIQLYDIIHKGNSFKNSKTRDFGCDADILNISLKNKELYTHSVITLSNDRSISIDITFNNNGTNKNSLIKYEVSIYYYGELESRESTKGRHIPITDIIGTSYNSNLNIAIRTITYQLACSEIDNILIDYEV